MYRGGGSAGGLGVAGGFGGDPSMMDESSVEGTDAVYQLVKSYDARMVPKQQRYIAPMGAQSSTSVNQKLTQVNDQTHTFPIIPPSPGVVIQPNIMYDLQCYVQFNASHVAGLPFGAHFPRYGTDFAIATSNPLNRMVQNWQVTVNNQTVQFQNIGNQDLVYLGENPMTRAARGTNYRTPLYTNWDDAWGSTQSLGDTSDLQGIGDVPPGAYDVDWLLPPGCEVFGRQAADGAIVEITSAGTTTQQTQVTLAAAAAAARTIGTFVAIFYDTGLTSQGLPSPNAVGITLGNQSANVAQPLSYPVAMPAATWNGVYYGTGAVGTGANGVPAVQTNLVPAGYPYVWDPSVTTPCPYCIYTRIIDPVQCPPFKYSTEVAFHTQGMWGVNNALVIASLTNPGTARWLQGTTKGGLTSLTYTNWHTLDAQLWLQYLTPPQTPQTLLPSRCVMGMMYKQYTLFNPTGNLATISAGATVAIPVPAYTFQCIPNFLVISVRPFATDGPGIPFNETDYCLTWGDSPFTQFTFSNTSGLLSNISKQQLVAICRKNGVQASVTQFGGLDGSDQYTGTFMKSGLRIGAGGAIMVLQPGVDFPLPLGTAPGTSGMIQIQYTLRVKNQGLRDVQIQVLTQALSTAYFVNDNGAAKQQLVGLDEETLLRAPFSGSESGAAHELVGGGAWDTIKNIGSKLWDHRNTIYNVARMGAKAFGVQLPDIDLGGRGMGCAGAGMPGAGAKRARQSGSGGDRQASLLAALAS